MGMWGVKSNARVDMWGVKSNASHISTLTLERDVFSDGDVRIYIGRGDVLDVGWVVLSDGKVIGRVTYLSLPPCGRGEGWKGGRGKGGRGECRNVVG